MGPKPDGKRLNPQLQCQCKKFHYSLVVCRTVNYGWLIQVIKRFIRVEVRCVQMRFIALFKC